ncbi:MAG: helix-hairpin-helix domain-containing protein, partial [Pseudomonadota bacterium]
RARWLEMAKGNAELALQAKLASRMDMEGRLLSLQHALDLQELPERMECFDISHTRGELTVASCVVFNRQGPLKSDYRRFNIEGITPGDDYAAMQQALERRYTRIKKGQVALPDILFIDGGKGQLSTVSGVLQELGISGLILLGVAKGPDRKAGMEQLFLLGRRAPIILPADSPALHLVQQIRDEAHRFAIMAHRKRRARSRQRSLLEEIPGIGPKRRQQLLKQFGGMQELSRAGVEDIARVDGVSTKLAEQIYHIFHDEG